MFPPCCLTWDQTMVEVMKTTATSFKRSHAGTATLSAPNPAAGHHQPMPPVTSTTGCSFCLAPSLHSFWSYFSTDLCSILGTYWPGEFIFQCPIFLPFHTVHRVLKARILKWFAIPFSVITHLEPDILECEVKWALESITMNKASGGDSIPVELFQILKDDAVKVLHSICQQIWKTHQWPQD